MTAIERAVEAAKVQSPDYKRSYPMSKAQATIIEALGITDSINFTQAESIFSELDIIVTSWRDGRKSVPIVTAKSSSAAMTAHGDYEEVNNELDTEVAQKLAEWM